MGIGKFNRRNALLVLLSILFFLPLMFLNIRHDHDWGGDFAQYIAQADNIAHFRPMNATGYVYNKDYPSLAPKAYPPGFPLLIAPIARLFGDYIPPYNLFISFLLVLTALFSVLLLRERFGMIVAVSLSLMAFYNPALIVFKSEVMADIPFSLMFIIFILLIVSTTPLSRSRWIWAGIAAGLASITKAAGYSLLVALFIYNLQILITGLINKEKRSTILKSAYYPLISLITGSGINLGLNLIFLKGAEGSGSYLNTFSLNNLVESIQINLYNYSEALRGYFTGLNTHEQWFGLLTGSAILTFFITGIIISVSKKPGLMEWVVIVYLGSLLVYPYHHSGFRFLIPVLPLILFYAARTVHSLNPGKGGIVLAVIVSAFMLWDYYPRIREIQSSTSHIQEGPYSDRVINAFRVVKSLTPANALVVFNKPTVLARYTGRRSMTHKPGSTLEEMKAQFAEENPSCFLLYNGLPDPSLSAFIESEAGNEELIWQDGSFRLYRKTGK